MAIELHHQNLKEMILKRPHSQRIFRLLREMQLSGAGDAAGNLRAVHGFVIAAVTLVLAIGVVTMPS